MENENKNNCQCNNNDEHEKNHDGCCEHDHEHEKNHDGCCGHDHEHEHEGCGCGHDHEEYDVIQLTLDDDTTLSCFIIGTFEVEDAEYIALLPEDEGEVLLYRFKEIENDEIELSNIEDEEEFNTVSEAFYELFGDDEEE